MSANILTRELSPKRVRQVLASVLILLILAFTTRAVVQHLSLVPRSPEKVRKIVRNYLEDKGKSDDFRTAVPIDAGNTVTELSAELATLQTAYDRLRAGQGALKEASKAREEEALAAQKTARAAQKQVDSPQKNGRQKNVTTEDSEALAPALKELETSKSAHQAQEALLAAAREAYALNRTQQNETRDRIGALEKELARSKSDARNAAGKLTAGFEETLKAATTYELIYQTIGQELWVVEQLLAKEDPAQSALAFTLAQTASKHASRFGYDDWLAARICEGYLLPQAPLIDADAGKQSPIEDGLYYAASVFAAAEEPHNVERAYEAVIKHSPSPSRADSARFRLARALESQGRFADALARFQAIQTEKLARSAKPRIENLERRLN